VSTGWHQGMVWREQQRAQAMRDAQARPELVPRQGRRKAAQQLPENKQARTIETCDSTF